MSVQATPLSVALTGARPAAVAAVIMPPTTMVLPYAGCSACHVPPLLVHLTVLLEATQATFQEDCTEVYPPLSATAQPWGSVDVPPLDTAMLRVLVKPVPADQGLDTSTLTVQAPEGAGEGDGEGEGLGEGDGDGEGEGDGLGEGEGEGDGFGEGDGDGEGLGDGEGEGTGVVLPAVHQGFRPMVCR